MKIQVFLPLILSVFFGGCVLTHEVEIKNHSAKYVKRSDIGSVIGDDVNVPLFTYWTTGDFIVLEIYTRTDLLELATEIGSILFVDSHFCEQPKKEVILGIPRIYVEGESITSVILNDRVTERNAQGIGDTLHKYDIALFVAWDKERKTLETLKKDKSQNHYVKKKIPSKRATRPQATELTPNLIGLRPTGIFYFSSTLTREQSRAEN